MSGNKQLKVVIDPKHVATVTAPNKYWNGSEDITFTVTDPEGASDKRTVKFTVESVNDLPEFVKPIKDQSIPEKREINLNDIVKDADHKLDQLSWSFDVKPAKGAPKSYTPQLKVTVDGQRMAKVVIPDKYWNGSEEITFKVEDPDGGKAHCTATFTVQSVNDAPTIGKINDQMVKEKEESSSSRIRITPTKSSRSKFLARRTSRSPFPRTAKFLSRLRARFGTATKRSPSR